MVSPPGSKNAHADHYEVLEISDDASPAEIKAAFRRLAKKLHPDKQPGEDAAAQFQALTKAYEVLSDPERRKHFDWLRAHKGGASIRSERAPERSEPEAPPTSPRPAPTAGEGARRRRHRYETARKVGEHGNENVQEHAAWLEELERQELDASTARNKSNATLWLAAMLLVIVIALLVIR